MNAIGKGPRVLAVVTWGYIAWSLIPVLILVARSFSGANGVAGQSLSLQWWSSMLHDRTLTTALAQSVRLGIATTIAAVPMGVALAVGVRGMRGVASRATRLLIVLPLAVPEVAFAVAIFLTFTGPFRFVPLGTGAQILGLVTLQIPVAALIVTARLSSIGPDLEEQAMDLGAPPASVLRYIILPILSPAIVASTVVVFALSISDFVTVRWLATLAPTQPLSIVIYQSRVGPSPQIDAAATFLLAIATVALGVGAGAGAVLLRRTPSSRRPWRGSGRARAGAPPRPQIGS